MREEDKHDRKFDGYRGFAVIQPAILIRLAVLILSGAYLIFQLVTFWGRGLEGISLASTVLPLTATFVFMLALPRASKYSLVPLQLLLTVLFLSAFGGGFALEAGDIRYWQLFASSLTSLLISVVLGLILAILIDRSTVPNEMGLEDMDPKGLLALLASLAFSYALFSLFYWGAKIGEIQIYGLFILGMLATTFELGAYLLVAFLTTAEVSLPKLARAASPYLIFVFLVVFFGGRELGSLTVGEVSTLLLVAGSLLIPAYILVAAAVCRGEDGSVSADHCKIKV
jgi:hypothetical protein